ncbi:MAG: protein translocase subunit SecD [Candidatus Eremiobacteraeota bacterium]|nr:protein translocase subunit SecD [Candidatus Eremiobacteraeota bacterium]
MNWNRIKNPVKGLVVIALVALSLYLILPVSKNIHLGLDLSGGARLLLQLKPTEAVPKITAQVQQQTVDVIDNRINSLGVAEPQISKVGGDRILVELPQVKNPDAAEEVLKRVAVLEFKIMPPQVAAQAEGSLAACTANPKDKKACDFVQTGAYAASGKVQYSGKDLKGAQAGYGSTGNNPIILFQTKDPKRFYDLTNSNLGKPLAIFLDHHYLSSPRINGPISDSGQIEGQFTQDQTILLANELNAGALPVSVQIIENETIGPTLGHIDLVKSLYASMAGLGLVLLFMIFVYRLPGLLADIALIVYVLMMLGLLAFAHATLTLPGIAGFVLSIGMAVDANVLIFERLKEELWAGKTMRAAVRTGFARAFTAVFDSHFTTIVGAGVLFELGTGTVKGFAYTLFWGTVLSLVTAVFITRFFVDALVDNDILVSPELYGVHESDVGSLAKVGA